MALHRHQNLLTRLERLGVSAIEFKRIYEEARRAQPTPETLLRLRSEARKHTAAAPIGPALPKTKTIVRAYCGVHRAQLVSFFVIAKGVLTLRPGECIALAQKMRQRARLDYLRAKERKLAVVARRLRPLFWIGRILMPNEVHRLELALRRCNDLASRQSAETYFREQRARAYRNSREALVAQLRGQTRAASLENNPTFARQERELEQRVASSATSIATRSPDEQAVARLRAGLEVLRTHRPAEYTHIAHWSGRESELVALVLRRTKDRSAGDNRREHAAALLAGRVGYLLAREQPAPISKLPPPLKSRARELSRANARLAAAGVDPPFTPEALRALRPEAIVRALGSLCDAGLLADGPGWALRAAAGTMADRLRKQMTADLQHVEEPER
jgi:hypothetical protein